MSFAVWNWLEVYKKWREKYLASRPPRKFPWPDEPLITLEPKGKEIIGKTKIGVILVFIVFLALSDSK